MRKDAQFAASLPTEKEIPEDTYANERPTSIAFIALGAIAFVLCILLSVAPLSRIPDPVIHLQTPLGVQFAQVGAWLPADLGLAADYKASLASTGYTEFLVLIALAFAIYGLCALLMRRQALKTGDHKQWSQTLCLIWLGTIAAGCIYVFTPAMLSHDILVYASYSRLMATYHANPYFVSLATFPQDPFNALNYWANSTAAYGPAWLGICALPGLVLGPQPLGYVLAFRLFALAAHLLNTWLVTSILRTSGRSPRIVTLGTLLYAWNPLVLLESSLGGHNDVFMVTFLLAGILLSIRAEKNGRLTQPRGYLLPIIAFMMAALVKFTMLPVVVLFIILLACRALQPESLSTTFSFRKAVVQRWRPALQTVVNACITSGLVVLILYGPFWIGHSMQSIQNSFTSPPSALYAENSILRALVAWSQAHTLPPASLGYKLVQIFSARRTWDYINFATIAGVIIAGAIYLWYSPTMRTFVLASLATLGALLIVTPWFYSWYITWLVALVVVCLPLAHKRIGRSLLAFTLTFSVSAFITYLFKDGYAPFGTWMGFVCLIMIAPPLFAFLIAFIYNSQARQPIAQPVQDVKEAYTDTNLHLKR